MKKVFALMLVMVFSLAILSPVMSADTNVIVKTEQAAFDNNMDTDDDDPKAKDAKKCDKKGKKCDKKKDCKKDADCKTSKKCDKKASAEKKSCCKKKETKA